MSLRILFVALPNSVHVMRWISQINEEDWDVRLFPSQPDPVHPDLRNVTVYGTSFLSQKGADRSVRFRGLLPFRTSQNRLDWLIHRYRPEWEVAALALVVRQFKPDIVHSLELQHAGYLTLACRDYLNGSFPKWIVTNWGSDISLFGRLEEHRPRIQKILETCDFYGAECVRDVELAHRMGYQGEVLPVIPNGGGYDLPAAVELRQPGRSSERRVVALKGYQGWAGRALFGLRALRLCKDSLDGYRVLVYSATDDVLIASELLKRSTGIDIQVVNQASHKEMLRMHGMARVSIGLSIGDGVSTSMLEAALMGSFPIQSDTCCWDEWIENGRTGILVDPEDPQAIAYAIQRALTEDDLIDRASEINLETARARLDNAKIQLRVVEMYDEIAKREEPLQVS